MIKQLVLATHNTSKAREMREVLSAELPQLRIQSLADYADAEEPEETGTTYQENARIKALRGAAATGQWCLADDAGLEIDFLKGAPGIYSKRYAGDAPFPEKMQRILDDMAGVEGGKRGARFRCAVALASPSGDTIYDFEDVCEGAIAHVPSGSGGFGYDPIFYLPEQKCTMADITAQQKHAISHRGKVLRLVAQFLRTMR